MNSYIQPAGALYLDDKRGPFKDDWVWAKTYAEACAALEGGVAHASLDFDLRCSDPEHTGADVAQFMADRDLWPSETLLVHSGSTDGRQAISAIVETSGRFQPAEEHYLGVFYRRSG